LPYAPRHIASVNFGYQHPVGFNARIGADYVSEQKPDAWTNTLTGDDAVLSGLAGTIPSYTLVNASASFKPVGSKLTYFVSGHNLTDKEYLATRVDGMGVGRGRQVFGGVRIDF
jgi:Fe(3+) dicitrate transport protein